MLYKGHDLCLSLPFAYPAHVFPVFKKVSCREKILLYVNYGTCTQITCNTCSHPLKARDAYLHLLYKMMIIYIILAGQLSFLYDSKVLKWSSQDLYFAYS
ncbi:hypothetical protein Ccrd_020010, partial [Cynara cardunculus var. scolymus]